MWRAPAADRRTDRRIGHMRVSWPAALPLPAEPSWRSAAEDALRTASTGELSRVVLVRRIGIDLPWRSGPRVLHTGLELALQEAIRAACPARGPAATQAGAVWFTDWDDAIGWLLEHWIAGEAPPAWIEAALAPTVRAMTPSAAVVPTPGGQRPSEQARQVFAAWMAEPASALAAATWALRRLAAQPHCMTPWFEVVAKEWDLEGCAGDEPADETNVAAEFAERARDDPPSAAGHLRGGAQPVIIAVLRRMVATQSSDWRSAARAVASAREMQVGPVTGPVPVARAQRAPPASRPRLRFVRADADARAPVPTGPIVPALSPPVVPVQPVPAVMAWPEAARAAPLSPASSFADPGAAEGASAHGGDPTRLGGLGLLINLLDRLGFATWLATQPPEHQRALAMAPFRCVLAHAMRETDSDEAPWRSVLEAPPDTGVSAAAGRAWLRRSARALRQLRCPGLMALLQRPAFIIVTPTHLDLVFDLARVNLAVRRAGLDTDPGWVPWFGRIVTLYYENAA